VIDIYVLIAVIVVLGVIGAALGLLAIKRLKARRAQLLNDLTSSPRHAGDRAFNRIEMARREVAILGRQGADTGRARDLIAQAQAAFDMSQFPRAYELAQSAHEALVHVRQTAPLGGGGSAPLAPSTSAGPKVGAPASAAEAVPHAAAPTEVPSSVPTPPRLAPNRAESQFQIRLLDSDLDSARSSRGSPSMIATASALRSQAQSAFDREQYTDALKFALRGRRELGGRVETLALSPGSTTGPAIVAPDGPTPDLSTLAERAASGTRCPQCGYPTRTDDGFCRGCGRPLVPTACSKCGAPRSAADTFCGKCGQRFS
jgi:Double zinc ribbon